MRRNIVCFPESMDLNILGKILTGGAEKGEFRPEIRTTSAPTDLNIPLPVQHRYETGRDLIPHRKVFFSPPPGQRTFRRYRAPAAFSLHKPRHKIQDRLLEIAHRNLGHVVIHIPGGVKTKGPASSGNRAVRYSARSNRHPRTSSGRTARIPPHFGSRTGIKQERGFQESPLFV